MQSGDRELRADARRNRAALLSAARAVFAERGLDAPLEEVARRAGVGIGTLYRRFATRAQLVEAVFTDRMAAYVAAAETAAADPDPWPAFRSYVLTVLSLQAEDLALADLLVTTSAAPGSEVERLRARAYRALLRLIVRAKAAGELRADFTHQDMVLILMANAGLVHRTAAAAPASCQRHCAFVLDGLHARAATPAPNAPSRAQVLAAMAPRTCDLN